MSRPLRRSVWIGGVALVAALAAYRIVGAGRGPAPRYDTVPVDRGPVIARVTASGSLSALVTVQVGSQVSGRIQTLYVDYNSPVRKGELLAKIDPPGTTFRGVVREVRNAPQTVQNVVTYDAVVDVDNPDLRLKPGMTANVTFVYARRDDVLRVPNAALRFHPGARLVAEMDGAPRDPQPPAGAAAPAGSGPGEHTVWVLKGEQARPVPIRTGVSDGTFSEVASGPLRVGERLVSDAESPSASPGRRPPGLF
jgi:multidrug efflux pump subunit AcrA (membrane-fusion protein)